MSGINECIFCINMPLGEIMIYTFDLFENPETSKLIAIESGELLRRAWLKDRFAMCGKSRIGFLMGAIYIVAILKDERLTQKDIAKVFEKSTMSVRNAYKRLLKILPDLDKIDTGVNDRSDFVKCVMCANPPNIEDFTVYIRNSYSSYKANIVIRGYCKLNDVWLHSSNIGSSRKCKGFNMRKDNTTLRSDLEELNKKVYGEISNGSLMNIDMKKYHTCGLERILTPKRRVKYVPEFYKKCPKCGEDIRIMKYDNGILLNCKYECAREDDDPICDPRIKCPDCEYLIVCGLGVCEGCKIPKGKACNFEEWIDYV